MKPALLLVDLQRDYLAAAGLEPAAGQVTERAASLLDGCRRAGVPVIHVWTTVRRADDRRMPHWRAEGRWRCEEGTPGHAPPPALAPRPGEAIVHKTDFSAFGAPDLDAILERHGVDTLLVAGVHLHACVRATVLDAYARRLTLWVADDAVASDDPLHAAITREYLAARAARFRPVDDLLRLVAGRRADATASRLPALVVEDREERVDAETALAHEAPAESGRLLFRVPVCGPTDVARATAAARRAAGGWAATPAAVRAETLARVAAQIAVAAPGLAQQIAAEVGKPIVQAREEVARALALLAAVGARGADEAERACGPRSVRRDLPVGVVALVTPWNNPLAIPIGKLAPALMFGNTVVWKPAPAGAGVALRVMTLLSAAGCPAGVVGLCGGDAGTAAALMADADVDAVALTGGSAAGFAAQAVCARRRIPLQAELGGNNAALVAADADLAAAARLVAAGAFEFAGQRCTANRRVIVEAAACDEFTRHLVAATRRLAWGRPASEATQVGPLVSRAARERVRAALARAFAAGATRLGPADEEWPEWATLAAEGAYLPPVLLRCDDPAAEIVCEETFGPVLVVQCAPDWTHALHMANRVRQGLVMAAFTASPERRRAFLAGARAGILKLDASTAGADVDAPFGGWKASGVGPPEHGASNRDFYTRPQAIYR